jgi:hypothetical protein
MLGSGSLHGDCPGRRIDALMSGQSQFRIYGMGSIYATRRFPSTVFVGAWMRVVGRLEGRLAL